MHLEGTTGGGKTPHGEGPQEAQASGDSRQTQSVSGVVVGAASARESPLKVARVTPSTGDGESPDNGGFNSVVPGTT